MNELSNCVLIMDDEPHLLDWLVEYLESKKYDVHQVTNVQDAISKLDVNKYRMVVLDLNVPASPEYLEKLKSKGELYVEYRGLYVAEVARTKGHRGRQVVVYSVHDSESVSTRSEEHTSELQSRGHLVCRLLLETKTPTQRYP